MEKNFFKYLAFTAVFFAIWMVLRNQIWNNETLYPWELVMIYLRDSGYFFLLLRIVFLAFFVWGGYWLWTTGQSKYLWLSSILYTLFLLLDHIILVSRYIEFKLVYEPWEAAYPMTIFFGFIEAVFNILFTIFVMWFLKDSRKKRRYREINVYQNI